MQVYFKSFFKKFANKKDNTKTSHLYIGKK